MLILLLRSLVTLPAASDHIGNPSGGGSPGNYSAEPGAPASLDDPASAEYARPMIFTEEQHAGEVDKMLRKPGDVEASGLGPSSLQ
jgi:hypothetical protein